MADRTAERLRVVHVDKVQSNSLRIAILPVPNRMNGLQACIDKLVTTSGFYRSDIVTSVVKFNLFISSCCLYLKVNTKYKWIEYHYTSDFIWLEKYLNSQVCKYKHSQACKYKLVSAS